MNKCERCNELTRRGRPHCWNCGKRLGSSVSGAEPCYAGREADVEQGAVEARSEEGMRVTPGEVKEAVEWALNAVSIHSSNCRDQQTLCYRHNDADGVEAMSQEAAKLLKIKRTLLSLLTEPDSEAKRSGRRNETNPAAGSTRKENE